MSNEEKEALKYFQGLKGRYKLSEEYALASLYLKDFYISWQKEKENNKNQDFDDMIRFVREAILRDDKLNAKFKCLSSKEQVVVKGPLLGSYMPITATAGLMIADYIIKQIINKE